MAATSSRIAPVHQMQIDDVGRAHLQCFLTARLLLHIKAPFKLGSSTSTDLAWAESLVRQINPLIMKAMYMQTIAWTYRIEMIMKVNDSKDIYIGYDIFINGCHPDWKPYLAQTRDMQLIYLIEKNSAGYRTSRAQFFDWPVAYDIRDRKDFGTGPGVNSANPLNPAFSYHARGQLYGFQCRVSAVPVEVSTHGDGVKLEVEEADNVKIKVEEADNGKPKA